MFYLVGILRSSSPGDSISSDPERTVLGKQGGESSYIEVCNRGQAGSPNIKRLLLIKENQISQEFITFLCMGKCKSLGLLKSFLSYASQLCGIRIL